MRISIMLLIFLVLFNGWGALMQDYGIDDELGINAETGDASELAEATQSAESIQTGQPTGSTLLGFYNSLLGTVEGMVTGLQPGVQLLVNVIPPGIGEDIVIWAAAILPIIIAVDILAYARGVDL